MATRQRPAASGARTLVELGSGSSDKTRHLLDAMPGLHTYVPVDVSESALRQAADQAESEFLERAERQRNYLASLANWADLDYLASDDMWR